MQFNEGFIGLNPDTGTLEFAGGETPENFKQKIDSQPDDWYYRFNKVTYSYNKLGHRCKNPEEIDLDNYILFAGCSHTEGAGLEVEKSYSYRVAEIMGCDYYNLALSGTGIDLLAHNLIRWAHYTDKMPKAVVIQWPDYLRFMAMNEHEFMQPHYISDGLKETERFILAGEDCNFFVGRREAHKVLLNSVYSKCNIINVKVPGFIGCPTQSQVFLNIIDFARDLSHGGIESNENLARDIVALLR